MAGTTVKVRIYLCDDHEIVRRGLRDLFEDEEDFEVVGESGSALEAQRRIPALRPHVAVLDARLPDGSGIDVCRAVRSIDPSIRALILTSYDATRRSSPRSWRERLAMCSNRSAATTWSTRSDGWLLGSRCLTRR